MRTSSRARTTASFFRIYTARECSAGFSLARERARELIKIAARLFFRARRGNARESRRQARAGFTLFAQMNLRADCCGSVSVVRFFAPEFERERAGLSSCFNVFSECREEKAVCLRARINENICRGWSNIWLCLRAWREFSVKNSGVVGAITRPRASLEKATAVYSISHLFLGNNFFCTGLFYTEKIFLCTIQNYCNLWFFNSFVCCWENLFLLRVTHIPEKVTLEVTQALGQHRNSPEFAIKFPASAKRSISLSTPAVQKKKKKMGEKANEKSSASKPSVAAPGKLLHFSGRAHLAPPRNSCSPVRSKSSEYRKS